MLKTHSRKDNFTSKQTDQTLLEQMRITEFDMSNRKLLLNISQKDEEILEKLLPTIETKIDFIVSEFYEQQTSIAEIALLIGDGDTLSRLKSAQRKYVLDLFSGVYDLEYINNRLRIGLVHKRIGVEPKLYLSAVYTLKKLLVDVINQEIKDAEKIKDINDALEKLFLFDVTLVFETYIRSMVSEIEISRDKSDKYASALEEKVRERTAKLEEITRLDALTGLQNVRFLRESLTRSVRACERRSEPLSFIYIDIDNFKKINDEDGHLKGDEILRSLGDIISSNSRAEDSFFRYGGDEFCMILPNCTEEEAKITYLDRIKQNIKKVPDLDISVGVIQTGPDKYLPVEKIIDLADKKMYENKSENKVNVN